jgi:membrane protein DedA with SNARE-associated domain
VTRGSSASSGGSTGTARATCCAGVAGSRCSPRTLVPASAGASDLEYRRFLPASIAGAVCWSALHIGIGSAAGASAKYIESVLGGVSWVLFGALALAGVLYALKKRRKTLEKVS